MVVLDRLFYHKHVRQVLLDNQRGATQMIKHLLTFPAAKTYIVTGNQENFDSQERLEAIHKVIRNTPPPHPVHIITGEFELDGGLEAAETIMQEWTGEPVNVFALSDSTAVGMQRSFQENGFVIGDQIKLAGFDNNLLSQYVSPPLTTVDYSTRSWGNEAATVLMALIANKEAHHALVPTTLMIRASTNS